MSPFEQIRETAYPDNKAGQFPDFSIVLVCWNNREYLEGCLRSLYESKIDFTYEELVVDNGSSDGSQAMLATKYPQANLIQNDRNLGLSRASNQGILASLGHYVLLLNNDTMVNGPSLNALVEFMNHHPDAGAAGGTLLNQDGSLQATYSEFSTLWQEFMIATGLGHLFWPNYPDHGISNEIKVVDWLSSACLILRRSALDQVGLLDEQYFIYGDEADLQYRLKRAGWKIYYLPQVKTIHYGGRSMNRWSRRKMVYRGKMLFYEKHYGAFRTISLRGMLVALSFLKSIFWLLAWPIVRERSSLELRSNLDVIRLCLNLK
jgi:GT2 family glycosyltransferase